MSEANLSVRTLATTRIAIGLLQGLALYLLYLAYDAKSWPATNDLVFAPLLLAALFVPLLILQASGNMRDAAPDSSVTPIVFSADRRVVHRPFAGFRWRCGSQIHRRLFHAFRRSMEASRPIQSD
jgi:hypothetical protein